MNNLTRSDEVGREVNDAGIKLNIFMTGMIATLSAVIAQQFEPGIIGSNSYTIEVYGLILILFSLVLSFLVIESSIEAMSQEGIVLGAQARLKKYVEAEVTKEMFDTESGDIISYDDMKERIPVERQNVISKRKTLKNEINKSKSYVRFRNIFFISGIVVVVFSKVTSAYFL